MGLTVIPFILQSVILIAERIADLNRVVEWLSLFIMLGRIYINATHIRLIKTGDNNLRVIGLHTCHSTDTRTCREFATSPTPFKTSVEVSNVEDYHHQKISRIATINRIVRPFFNNLNILECHIGLTSSKYPDHSRVSLSRFGAFHTLNRQITFPLIVRPSAPTVAIAY